MAADNSVAFERLELLGQSHDKEEEMHFKQIPVGIAQQAMLTANSQWRRRSIAREYRKDVYAKTR